MFKVGDLVHSNAFSDEKHYGIIKEISTDEDIVPPFNDSRPRIIYYVIWFEYDVAPDYVYEGEIKLAY